MTSLVSAEPLPQPSHRAQRLLQLVLDNSIYVALITIFLIYSVIAAPYNFLTFGNIVNILISAADLGLITCGLTIAVLAGQIDLSTAGVAVPGGNVLGLRFQTS